LGLIFKLLTEFFQNSLRHLNLYLKGFNAQHNYRSTSQPLPLHLLLINFNAELSGWVAFTV